MTRPHNHFEIAALRDRTLEELGLAEVTRLQALVALAVEWLRPMESEKEDPGSAVAAVRDLCVAADYPSELMDFYLLALAHEALQVADDQHYWPGATRANIGPVMRRRVASFMAQFDETSNRALHPRASGDSVDGRG